MLALCIKLHDIHILQNVQKQVKAIGLKEWAAKRKAALKYHKNGNKKQKTEGSVTFRFAPAIDLSAHFFIKDKQANMNLKI